MNHGARRGLERGSCRFNLMARLLNGHQKLVLNHVFSELCLVALVEACDVALAATQFHELLAEMDDTNGILPSINVHPPANLLYRGGCNHLYTEQLPGSNSKNIIVEIKKVCCSDSPDLISTTAATLDSNILYGDHMFDSNIIAFGCWSFIGVAITIPFQHNLSMDSRLRWLYCHYLDNIFPGNPDTTARIIENVPPAGTRTSFANLMTSSMHGETIICSSFTAVRWRALEQVENDRYLKRQLKIIISAIQTVMERMLPSAPPPIKTTENPEPIFFAFNINPSTPTVHLLIYQSHGTAIMSTPTTPHSRSRVFDESKENIAATQEPFDTDSSSILSADLR
ncbi:hypothetical protein DPV78_000486 [Talaromyces pinophilus]|nr:hypothetical protein DPV78_000486 [Talaromyces pinophilus]